MLEFRTSSVSGDGIYRYPKKEGPFYKDQGKLIHYGSTQVSTEMEELQDV